LRVRSPPILIEKSATEAYDNMLISLLLDVFVSALNVLVFWLPDVTSLNITVGSFDFPIDDYLSTGLGYVFYIFPLIPPLEMMYNGFLFIIYWKIGLLTVRLLPWIGRLVR